MKTRKQTKSFNGENFKLASVQDEKKFADMSAQSFRNGGQKARVVKVSNGYAVYHRSA